MAIFFSWLLDRLKEPSTWQGLVTIATAAGIQVNPDVALHVATVGASIFGMINVVKKG
jgi:hypothetical protein